jgi:hypothetical protein
LSDDEDYPLSYFFYVIGMLVAIALIAIGIVIFLF